MQPTSDSSVNSDPCVQQAVFTEVNMDHASPTSSSAELGNLLHFNDLKVWMKFSMTGQTEGSLQNSGYLSNLGLYTKLGWIGFEIFRFGIGVTRGQKVELGSHLPAV